MVGRSLGVEEEGSDITKLMLRYRIVLMSRKSCS